MKWLKKFIQFFKKKPTPAPCRRGYGYHIPDEMFYGKKWGGKYNDIC